MAAAAAACVPLHYTTTPTACGSNIITGSRSWTSSSRSSRAPAVRSRSSSRSWGFEYMMTTSPRREMITWCSGRSSSSHDITDFDLYDLMGIDSTSDHSQIRSAYRTLQKRCHPDIAGPAGHDMAIILNQAYALLSDPNSRSAYDKEQAKFAQLRGYSGKPLYSVWFGSESEERAVFVDEVKCIGCLKCALCAENTFAIESVYGRARVVGQWADPEHKIQEAIQACPVDCISIVERSNLAALEFLMSKQPRGNVRVGMGNTAGERVSNIFVDVKKFQSRLQDAKEKASTESSMETDPQREARLKAIQAIRSISNWLYWKTPPHANAESLQNLKQIGHKSRSTEQEQPNIGKLRDAAAAMKQARESTTAPIRPTTTPSSKEDYYWVPLSSDALPASSSQPSPPAAAAAANKRKQTNDYREYRAAQEKKQRKRNPIKWVAPVGTAMVAVVIGRLQGDGAAVGGVTQHMAGSFALEIVNSSWLPTVLLGITWYIIGMIVVGLVDAIRSKQS